MAKIRIGILRGGPSSEYEVSLKTGAHVLKNLPEEYESVDIFIDKAGMWHIRGIAEAPEKIFRKVDAVFNALHGEYGEDGGLQRLLDNFAVPYSGSGRVASAFAMHKGHAKNLLKRHGIKTPHSKTVKKSEMGAEKLQEFWKTMSQPSVVKPVALGSSIGVSVARNFLQFEEALGRAFALSPSVLVEEYIPGREATVGVIENFRGEREYALLPVELSLAKGSDFLDYNAKYGGAARAVHPGRFSEGEKRSLAEAAKAAHRALGLRHYSRSDFIVSPSRGVYFLEANSLPGLYEGSPFAGSLQAVGVSFPDFLHHVLSLTLGNA